MTSRLRSVRVRATAAATLVVAVTLVIAVWGVLAVMHHRLVADVDVAIRARAADVVLLARRVELPPILRSADDETPAVQVIDGRGAVISRSGYVPANKRLSTSMPVAGGRSIRTVEHPPVGDGPPYRVFAFRPRDAGGITIYTAGSLEAANASVAAARRALTVAVPLVTLVVAALTFLIVGRALRPVEQVRRQVAEITASSIDRRIPDPRTADEISRLTTTMNAMLDRLDEAARRQAEFVADASHELRSPLASIQTQLDVALVRPETTDWPAVAERILAENLLLRRMTDDLLTLGGADTRGRASARELVDLDEVVLRQTESLRVRSRLTIDISGVEGGRVVGNAAQLARLVRNLVDNAEVHARSRISVVARRVDSSVELAVADDGPGIPPADRERVFERFTRLDEARNRDRGGTGLGLAIARAIVVAHGGSIEIEDARPGARVVVFLPAAREAEPIAAAD